MRCSRLLFLLGGSDDGILDVVAEEFVPAAGGSDAAIALLMIGGEGWESYVQRYVEPWKTRGVTRWYVVVPGEDGCLDLPTIKAQLFAASGIFIAGGHTPTYHRLYGTEPVRSLIRERYREGIPVAGLSAGALISPEVCLFRPSPKNPDQPFRIVEGLGLASNLVVEVHFTEGPGTLSTLLEGMAQTRTSRGLGIGPAACAVLENDRLVRVLGQGVYEVVMTDFETRRHTITEVYAEP